MKLGKKFGSHSDTHPHVNNLSYEKNIEEIEKSNDKIEKCKYIIDLLKNNAIANSKSV